VVERQPDGLPIRIRVILEVYGDLKSFQSKAATADDQTFLILTEETPVDASADSATKPPLPVPALATNAPL